ncbi:MAG: hypothetical protein WCF15_04395 [Pseudolabrys sp.]
MLAVAFLFAMVWDDLETSFSAAIASMQTDANAESVVLSFTHGGSSVAGNSEPVFLVDFDADRETCELDSTVALSRLKLAAINDNATTDLVPLHANPVAHQSADSFLRSSAATAHTSFPMRVTRWCRNSRQHIGRS